MTRDLRQPSAAEQLGRSESGPQAARPRLRVLRALRVSAALSAAAGLYLLLGEQALVPPDVARLLAGALLVVAAMDMVAASVLQRLWRDPPPA
jgi:hypothetical protein